ncbi:MAG: zinc ribbon domain-containing protein [Ignavibacteria bacterium]
MPIFEYQCKDCNQKFEVLHKSSECREEVICPKCNSANNKKLLSTFTPAGFSGSSKRAASCSGGSCPAMDSHGGCGSDMCGLN